ncbi:MAG: hypothetical protein HOH66_00085, partial [Rhodospirillaceae bacterium]|nr:hypothetical protein [Rhodospirillaceae bacterium]
MTATDFSVDFAPLLPEWGLITLAGLMALGLLASLPARAGGWPWRALAAAAILLVLANPQALIEERSALPDVLLALVDDSGSQKIGDRPARTETALAELERIAEGDPSLELRTALVKDAGDGGGTRLLAALDETLAAMPRERLAAIVAITDGRIHDPLDVPIRNLDAPIHVLLTGERHAFDRRITIVQAPGFAIVDRPVALRFRVMEAGGAPAAESEAAVVIRLDGRVVERRTAAIGRTETLEVTPEHAGELIVELEIPPREGELTLANNRAVTVLNAVRDRLKVLLISGEPHPGERTWRRFLKSDPSVDLIHFTILRPPEKQDRTPLRELSLITFPVRELFEVKLHDFDLVIFDRYRRRGVLPLRYVANIVEYVRGGGAVLVAVGPTFATPLSLYNTPLREALPGAPTGRVVERRFLPRLTESGRRHPITDNLAGGRSDEPRWGPWFRQIEVDAQRGTVLMEGAEGRPLLILDRFGEGRVAQILSDHLWLWARDYEGGGPQAELLRRLSHWLMKEPELEEDVLRATADRDRIEILRRSLEPLDRPVTVFSPSGQEDTLRLIETGQGRATATLEIEESGLYRIVDGDRETLVAAGALNP